MVIEITEHALPGMDDITRVELENRIVVLARENYASPAVVVDGLLWGGANQEAADKAGVANYQSALLTRGTIHHSFNDFYEIIEGAGASLDIGSGRHTHSFGSKSLAEDLPTMLGLLAEALIEPTFPDEYVEKVRGQIITGLQYRAHNTRSMAALTFRELVYPSGHPYARSRDGYIETVNAINRDDIVEYHRHLGPQGAIIVVVGAVKPHEAVQLVRDAFEGWQNLDQWRKEETDDVPALTEIKREDVNIPGKTQSDIAMGFPGPRRSAPDFQHARIANHILGRFGMMGRLGDNVREKQGLAYYSFSQLGGGFGPSPWSVSAGVAPENVEKAVNSIQDEIRRMIDEPVTDEELSDNKSFFKGQLFLGLETNEGVAGSIKNIEMHELGLDYLHGYRDMIDAITIEDVQAASQIYLNPDAYALGVAGPETA